MEWGRVVACDDGDFVFLVSQTPTVLIYDPLKDISGFLTKGRYLPTERRVLCD